MKPGTKLSITLITFIGSAVAMSPHQTTGKTKKRTSAIYRNGSIKTRFFLPNLDDKFSYTIYYKSIAILTLEYGSIT